MSKPTRPTTGTPREMCSAVRRTVMDHWARTRCCTMTKKRAEAQGPGEEVRREERAPGVPFVGALHAKPSTEPDDAQHGADDPELAPEGALLQLDLLARGRCFWCVTTHLVALRSWGGAGAGLGSVRGGLCRGDRGHASVLVPALGLAVCLEGADPGRDGPAVLRGDLRGVGEHGPLSVRHHVVEVAQGHRAQAILVQARRLDLEAAAAWVVAMPWPVPARSWQGAQ